MNADLGLILLVIALILGALQVIRSRGEDLAGWGVLLVAVVLVFFR